MPRGLGWDTNMAPVSLFGDTNMATVTLTLTLIPRELGLGLRSYVTVIFTKIFC